MKSKFVIVTPVRDEEAYIRHTLESVIAQTIQPSEWVIVDDGSTDATGTIIDDYSKKFSWIRTIHRRDRGFRQAGGGVVEAFYEGYRSLQTAGWDFVVKLDGDLTFSPGYFQQCLEHFNNDEKLGIGGGEIYHRLGGELKLEAGPRFHVRGATKIYRKACWEAIGGLFAAPGWDTVDEVKANMLGWSTHSFSELRLVHHRFTGSADGLLHDRVKYGSVCFICGYHPLFVLARCFYRLLRRPYVIGSLAILFGFIRGYISRSPQVNDKQMIRYLRNQQLRRLFGMETIWR